LAAGALAHEERLVTAEYLPETVRDLADAGDKLAATKAYRDQMGVSLMEAKNAIEGYLNNR
jgi:ribosomal protein L7/L12